MSVLKDIREDLEKGAVKLITEYRDRLFAEAVRLCSDRSSAEDLVSRTFIRVLANIDRQEEYDNLFAWMKTVMLNIHRNDLKRPVAHGTLPVEAAELEEYAGADNRTIEEIMLNSDKDALRIALDRLDPEYRQVVSMYYFSELSLKDIACLLHSSTSSISRRLQTARQILAAKLGAATGKKKMSVLVGALVLVGAAFASWTTGFFGLQPDREPEAPASEQTVEETVLTNDIYQTTKEETQMKTNGMTMAAAVVAGVTVLGAHADRIVGEIMPDDALEFAARQTENGYLYVDELNRTNAVEIFLTSGTWTIPDGVTVFDYFVVGGGGSGASRYGGGGGAGGVIAGTVAMMNDFSSRDLAIVVGAGGAAVTGQSGGKKGASSEIRAIVDSAEVSLVKAFGGGAGLRSTTNPGAANDGGSGGGGSWSNKPGGQADAGMALDVDWIISEMYARKGGYGSDAKNYKGGGGGGAGEAGNSVADGGKGGDGIETFITGKSAWFAGGGGGASGTGSDATVGGKGGGGAGSGNVSAEAGTPNTGSGGGGVGQEGSYYSGAGGSGIVIVRHLALPARTDPVTQYKLAVKASKGGKVSGTKAGAYDAGSPVMLVAKPKPGYQLVSWTINGVPVSQDEKLFFGLAFDTTVVANFELLNAAFEWGRTDGRKVPEVVVAFTNEIMGTISWELPEWVKSFDYVVVGGGGSGASRYGGGGGAGGVITGRVSSVESFTSRQLAITVGAGGKAVTGQKGGNKGSPSEIRAMVGSAEVSLVQAFGGGAGLQSTATPGAANNGGSGGGGSWNNKSGGQADAGIVYDADWVTGGKCANGGGNGSSATNWKGGGGGGAGEAGDSVADGSKGGDGIETFITGKSLWLAGGGGGASGRDSSVTVGGKGGGGAGSGNVSAEAGTPNTGSGGGGLGENGTDRYSGAGGSGIVILRYAYPKPPRGLAIIVF